MATGFAEWSLEDGRNVPLPELSPLAFEQMFVILGFGIVAIELMMAM